MQPADPRDRTVEAAAGDAPAPERTAGSIGRMRREAHFVLTSQDLDRKHSQRARRRVAIMINADFDLWSTVRAPQGLASIKVACQTKRSAMNPRTPRTVKSGTRRGVLYLAREGLLPEGRRRTGSVCVAHKAPVHIADASGFRTKARLL